MGSTYLQEKDGRHYSQDDRWETHLMDVRELLKDSVIGEQWNEEFGEECVLLPKKQFYHIS